MALLSRYYELIFLNIQIDESHNNHKRSIDISLYQKKCIKEVKELIDSFFAPTDTDQYIQKWLVQFHQNTFSDCHVEAGLALRCFITNQIFSTCKDLVSKHGKHHQVELSDLLVRSLDRIAMKPLLTQQKGSNQDCKYLSCSLSVDDFLLNQIKQLSPENSLTSNILNNFNVKRGGLSNLTRKETKRFNPIRRLLRSQGVDSETAWFKLYNCELSYLMKSFQKHPIHHVDDDTVFTDFEDQFQVSKSVLRQYSTQVEIDSAIQLLKTFQDIYIPPANQTYPCPTEQQLIQIGNQMNPSLSTEETRAGLKQLALFVRKFKKLRSDSYPSVSSNVPVDPILEHISELVFYKATYMAISQRYEKLIKQPKKAQSYLEALKLFYVKSLSGSKIAMHFDCDQSQVSRLLKLTELRSQAKGYSLSMTPIALAKTYCPNYIRERLQNITQAVNDYWDAVIKDELAQAKISTDSRSMNTPFAKAVCQAITEFKDFDADES